MKVVVLTSHTPSLFWFRVDMILEFIKHGHEVVAVGNEDENKWKDKFSEHGIKYRQAIIQRNGTNPVKDINTLRSIKKILREEKPDKVFTYQAKTVIYGVIAAHQLGITEVYPLIAGVGSVFLSKSIKSKLLFSILKREYKYSLNKCPNVFFQNTDDVSIFLRNKIVQKDKIVMINGSGVNFNKFTVQDLPENIGFLCISRLIRDKGIIEYLQACRIIKMKYPHVKCMLVGPFDSNPTAIQENELQPYIDDDVIEYFGEQEDVRPYLAKCNVYVLPSYREGIPKTILEAMASYKAIITTDAPGCKETVIDGVNGYLVPVKNTDLLAKQMEKLINNPEIIVKMADEGLKIVTDKFDVNKINKIIYKTMKL